MRHCATPGLPPLRLLPVKPAVVLPVSQDTETITGAGTDTSWRCHVVITLTTGNRMTHLQVHDLPS